jgi:hypothetical protein
MYHEKEALMEMVSHCHVIVALIRSTLNAQMNHVHLINPPPPFPQLIFYLFPHFGSLFYSDLHHKIKNLKELSIPFIKAHIITRNSDLQFAICTKLYYVHVVADNLYN